jgi:hypothetical protein
MTQTRITSSWIGALPLALAVGCAADASPETAQPGAVQPARAALLSLADPGYAAFPSYLVDINNDGRADACRYVGDAPNIFLSCKYDTPDGQGDEYAYNSIPGIDRGLEGLPSAIIDVNHDNRPDFCRFVGDYPPGDSSHVFLSCDLGDETGFDPNQYGFNSPSGVDLGYPENRSINYTFDDQSPVGFCRYIDWGPAVHQRCCIVANDGQFGPQQYVSTPTSDCNLNAPDEPPTTPPTTPTTTPPTTPPTPINQPVDATCVCPINSELEPTQTRTLCFNRGTDPDQILRSAFEQCQTACTRITENNWQLEEDTRPGYIDLDSFKLAGGDCTQPAPGFEFPLIPFQ